MLVPLTARHEDALTAFFDGLSTRTCRFYSVVEAGERVARAHCAAIAKYDKLRLVLVADAGTIIALVEFSFDVPLGDVHRYARHGLQLDPMTDCRWGLCVSDAWQGQGIGTALAPPSFEIARRFGQHRVILWGGVHVDNEAGVRYYRKVGFAEVGRFTSHDGVVRIDMLCDVGEA